MSGKERNGEVMKLPKCTIEFACIYSIALHFHALVCAEIRGGAEFEFWCGNTWKVEGE